MLTWFTNSFGDDKEPDFGDKLSGTPFCIPLFFNTFFIPAKLWRTSSEVWKIQICVYKLLPKYRGGHRGPDRMIVGFATTYAISAYHHWCCEFESWLGRGVQHYVIKFVSDLRQVSGFHWVLRLPPSIKVTATI